jgi:RNA polymerase sigma-70 factor (ECF subfamily)
MPDDWPLILERDGPHAWSAAYRLLGNRADSDECFQEACLAALEVSRRETVRSWKALLLRLTVARAVDRIRQRKRGPTRLSAIDGETIASPSPPPWQSTLDGELADRLRLALTEIPPDQAQVFCLNRLENLSYREIAEALRITVDSVGVRLHRARERLQSLLADDPEPLPTRMRKEARP